MMLECLEMGFVLVDNVIFRYMSTQPTVQLGGKLYMLSFDSCVKVHIAEISNNNHRRVRGKLPFYVHAVHLCSVALVYFCAFYAVSYTHLTLPTILRV